MVLHEAIQADHFNAQLTHKDMDLFIVPWKSDTQRILKLHVNHEAQHSESQTNTTKMSNTNHEQGK